MTHKMPEPVSELEAEGIPDHVGALPSKDATGDGQEGIFPPGDEPIAATDFGTTAEEMREGESLDGRLARELPEVTLDTPLPTEEGAPGRLVEDDAVDGLDVQQDVVAHDVGTDRGGFSAEEAAMHIEPQ